MKKKEILNILQPYAVNTYQDKALKQYLKTDLTQVTQSIRLSSASQNLEEIFLGAVQSAGFENSQIVEFAQSDFQHAHPHSETGMLLLEHAEHTYRETMQAIFNEYITASSHEESMAALKSIVNGLKDGGALWADAEFKKSLVKLITQQTIGNEACFFDPNNPEDVVAKDALQRLSENPAILTPQAAEQLFKALENNESIQDISVKKRMIKTALITGVPATFLCVAKHAALDGQRSYVNGLREMYETSSGEILGVPKTFFAPSKLDKIIKYEEGFRQAIQSEHSTASDLYQGTKELRRLYDNVLENHDPFVDGISVEEHHFPESFSTIQYLAPNQTYSDLIQLDKKALVSETEERIKTLKSIRADALENSAPVPQYIQEVAHNVSGGGVYADIPAPSFGNDWAVLGTLAITAFSALKLKWDQSMSSPQKLENTAKDVAVSMTRQHIIEQDDTPKVIEASEAPDMADLLNTPIQYEELDR